MVGSGIMESKVINIVNREIAKMKPEQARSEISNLIKTLKMLRDTVND